MQRRKNFILIVLLFIIICGTPNFGGCVVQYNTDDNEEIKEEPAPQTLETISIILEETSITLGTILDKGSKKINDNIIRTTQDNRIQPTKEELDILFRITEAEATGGTIAQKRNVACNVINRILADNFRNDIESVVFASKQYSPIYDGRYWSVSITEETKEAVFQAIKGIKVHDGTFFLVRSHSDIENVIWVDNHLEWVFNDGLHDYYKESEEREVK